MESQMVSVDLPLLTFNSLYNLLREEKKSRKLAKLDVHFYEALDKFFEDKKTEIKRFKEAGETEKYRRESHVLKNSKKIAAELTNLRCCKIADIAIKNQIFGEGILETDNILEFELQYLESVEKATKKMKNKNL
jgi:DNA replication initiation complex subunit (GINS family)